MGIVVFLPALALSAVTGFNLTLCIVLMGLIATVYTAFGGIKAVIWTDVIQVVVLIGGALLALILITSQLDGGFSTLVSMGKEAGKFEMPPIEWSWAKNSFMVLILGAIFSNALVPYTSDQAVVQRDGPHRLPGHLLQQRGEGLRTDLRHLAQGSVLGSRP